MRADHVDLPIDPGGAGSVQGVSYHAYNMPPPLPVDPTDVAGKRIGAWFIDAVIYVVASNLLAVLLGVGPKINSQDFDSSAAAERFCETWRSANNGVCSHAEGTATTITNIAPAIWLFVALVVVFIVYQGLLGASLGKLALGLRIVKADGSLAGVGASALRTVLWVVDAITCAAPIVGGILILTTKGHRRVGDMAAGTFVVPHTQVGHPVILPGQPGWGTYQPGPYQPTPQPGAPGGPGGFGQPSGFGQPGAPAVGPSATPPAPWAPTTPTPGEAPGSTEHPGPAAADAPGGGYEADKPIWDDARNAYIQYDSERSAWLEYDDVAKEWKPIST
jgi:uncharacterized RDD family membrane protein YckC